MKAQQQRIDLQIKRTAQARIAEIDAELASPTEGTDAEKLATERGSLVGSWILREEVEIEGLLTEAEGIAADQAAAKEAERQAIRDELAANDAKAMRAFFEGDKKRIEEHNAIQETLREKLRAI